MPTGADLSTLTNIRIQNRRSKQRLAQALAETTSPVKGGLFDFLDESTQSPIKRPSPLRQSYTHRDFSRERLTGALENLEIDSSLLEKENLRYLDKDLYDRDIKLNDVKRERLMNGMYTSPELTRTRTRMRSPLRSMSQSDSSKDARLRADTGLTDSRFDDVFSKAKSKGFRPRDVPDLKTASAPSQKINPVRLAPKEIPSPKSSYLADLDTRLKDVMNDDFDKLVQKYDLKSSSGEDKLNIPKDSTERLETFQVQRLQQKIQQMGTMLEDYRDQMRSTSGYDEDLIKRNMKLSKEITKLNDFIKFMDANFQEIYNVWKQDKDEKERLIAKMQEMKLQEVRLPSTRPHNARRRSLSPLKVSLSPPKLSPLKHIHKLEPFEEPTEELLKFNLN